MKNIGITFILLFACAVLFAQTADEIQTLLQTPAISYAQAARFALEAADVTGPYDITSSLEAARFAADRQWLPKNAEPDGAASLDGIALLLMRSFGLKGGFMYSLAKSPHYAFRELVFKGVIHGKAYPKMPVQGDKFLFMINRILALKETGGNI